ncbi:hypothetical protein EV649_0915 [Kribbella sp. VKM Ac-2569]|uniref:hypothetical protein n=1 Tax=Kribbella sp. VKM Ac-2569 TaxID=2512220 RepID=UPI00102B75D3|nr:hypothetical protein [Kribbella sp. VKM Ac-2569]RZT27161.1 hypothetical protein EV649_0915 [Kribbella sp. VKM Ac-2569]
MPRRPLLAAVATLSTLTLLTACNGSPEAGRPNTTPTTTSAAATPTPTAPSTPTWTPAEQTAIAAAKKQYTVARAAIDTALASPAKADQAKLASAGNGGAWMTTVLEDLTTFQEYGWYESGRTKITTLQVSSVNLKLEQPEVRLINCIDSSAVVIRSQADNKPVSAGTGTKKPKKVSSSVVYAPSATGGAKRWWLIAEQELGAC